jgi:hypothetical protein
MSGKSRNLHLEYNTALMCIPCTTQVQRNRFQHTSKSRWRLEAEPCDQAILQLGYVVPTYNLLKKKMCYNFQRCDHSEYAGDVSWTPLFGSPCCATAVSVGAGKCLGQVMGNEHLQLCCTKRVAVAGRGDTKHMLHLPTGNSTRNFDSKEAPLDDGGEKKCLLQLIVTENENQQALHGEASSPKSLGK